MIKAIETRYNGYRFRSRLEARWAVFFDAMGVKYEYEKEGFSLGGVCYLPDFWLPDQQLWLEIKGQPATDDERVKASKLFESTHKAVFINIGPPDPECAMRPSLMFGECGECGAIRGCRPGAYFVLPCNHYSFPLLMSDKVFNAYIKARSARFEFGESG